MEDVAQAHSNAGRSVVEAEIGLGQIGARIGTADDPRSDAKLGHGTKRPVRVARLGPPITVGDLATSIDATLSEDHVLRRGAHYRAPVIKPLRDGALALILEDRRALRQLASLRATRRRPCAPRQGLELDRVLDGRRSHVGFGNNGDVRSLRCSQKGNFVYVSGASDAIYDEGTSYFLGVIDGRRDRPAPRQLSLSTPAHGEERLGARCRLCPCCSGRQEKNGSVRNKPRPPRRTRALPCVADSCAGAGAGMLNGSALVRSSKSEGEARHDAISDLNHRARANITVGKRRAGRA